MFIKKHIYLAGPMTGLPLFNFPAFNAAAKVLREAGHEVFNPAEQDTATYGEKFSTTNKNGDVVVARDRFGFNLRTALHADLTFICLEADTIALLPGWEKSRGVAAEIATARALGFEEIYL